jgi:proteasome lid subunit RPN8/RPN11
MLHLSPDHLQSIHQHLTEVYPEEGCGLILGRVESDEVMVLRVITTENVWQASEIESELEARADRSKHDRYEIAPQEMLAAMKLARLENLEIIGIYHSHPDHPAKPSECDRRLAWPQYIYLICRVDNTGVTETTAWQLDDREQFQIYDYNLTAH